jgi:hypothetical protein
MSNPDVVRRVCIPAASAVGRGSVPVASVVRRVSVPAARRHIWKPALLALAFLLLPLWVGCAARPATPTPSPTAALSPTLPAAPTPRQVIEVEPSGRLVSQWADSPPAIDGRVEGTWESAEPLHLPLTWGMGGTERALDVELRSLYTDQAIYFAARWSGEPPPGAAPGNGQNTVSNVLTVHWRIPEPAAQRLDCNVACHTAFADASGRLAYANAETIPQGGSEALAAAGGWNAGMWTLEWSRPLINGNPYDLQFDDREAAYSFLVKVFARVEGRPDPISARHLLVFAP